MTNRFYFTGTCAVLALTFLPATILSAQETSELEPIFNEEPVLEPMIEPMMEPYAMEPPTTHLPVDTVGPVFTPNPTGAATASSSSGGTAATTQQTNSIIVQLEGAASFCSRIQSGYAVDCLSDQLAEAASELPTTGDYAEVREALESASTRLRGLTNANRDRSKPAIRARTSSRATTRPLRAVAPSVQASVQAQATAILEETATVLLRSADSSANRAIHFQRIAQAVDSTKVLLRS